MIVPAIAGLGWAVLAAPLAMGGTGVSRLTSRVASGDQYEVTVLRRVADVAGRPTGLFCNDRFLRDALLIRSRLAELSLAAGEITEIDQRYDDVRSAATALLACSPGHALGWLAFFWTDLQTGRAGTAETREMLRRSYRLGPHEFWIQVRRNPLALSTYDTLPDDLKAAALDEFVDILKAGGFAQAASILLGPGSHLMPTLRERISPLPEYTRRMLALQFRAMREDFAVPGIEPRDPRWR
jgi:hypothetical protein